MFQVTTVLPPAEDPISKTKLIDKKKVPKTEAELKEIEEAKKAKEAAKKKAEEEALAKLIAEGKEPKKKKEKKKKEEGPSEADLFNFEPIPLDQ